MSLFGLFRVTLALVFKGFSDDKNTNKIIRT